MQASIVSATEANRSFSEILNKVYYQKQVFDIKRGKEIIAKIIPVTQTPAATLRAKDLSKFFHHLPALENEDKQTFSREIGKMREKLLDAGRQWE